MLGRKRRCFQCAQDGVKMASGRTRKQLLGVTSECPPAKFCLKHLYLSEMEKTRRCGSDSCISSTTSFAFRRQKRKRLFCASAHFAPGTQQGSVQLGSIKSG
ncbi:hypothetical protein PoB_006038100 [Plakobranchus ocellatus]|uniref:Uncharacterized protein n=1 Tax=Plakobranchus ocellatus TaxID=259542 RepID=A0AAV4CPU4_9GAST|nr:hypothetical protein PoB_006038100 [Plakobranchus ocellatus]